MSKIAEYIKKSREELDGGIWDDDPLEIFWMLEQLQAENDKLKAFAREIIKQECWGIDCLDGCDIQELATKLGLIESCIAIEDDIAFGDFEVGDVIYKFTYIMKGGE